MPPSPEMVVSPSHLRPRLASGGGFAEPDENDPVIVTSHWTTELAHGNELLEIDQMTRTLGSSVSRQAQVHTIPARRRPPLPFAMPG
jgi:hypothetical protein